MSRAVCPWRALLYKLRGAPLPLFVSGDRVVPAAAVWTGSRCWVAAMRALGLGNGGLGSCRLAIRMKPSIAMLQSATAALYEGHSIVWMSSNDPVREDVCLELSDNRSGRTRTGRTIASLTALDAEAAVTGGSLGAVPGMVRRDFAPAVGPRLTGSSGWALGDESALCSLMAGSERDADQCVTGSPVEGVEEMERWLSCWIAPSVVTVAPNHAEATVDVFDKTAAQRC